MQMCSDRPRVTNKRKKCGYCIRNFSRAHQYSISFYKYIIHLTLKFVIKISRYNCENWYTHSLDLSEYKCIRNFSIKIFYEEPFAVLLNCPNTFGQAKFEWK